MTIGTMDRRLARRLGDPVTSGGADGSRFTYADRRDLLTEAQVTAALTAPVEALWNLTVRLTGPNSAGTHTSITIPSTMTSGASPFLRIAYITFQNDDGDEIIGDEVSALSRTRIQEEEEGEYATEENPKWYIEAGVIKFLPSVSNKNKVAFYYVKRPAALQSTTTLECTTMPPLFHEGLVNYAAYLGLFEDAADSLSMQKAVKYEQDALKHFRTADRVSPGPVAIAPMTLPGEIPT